MRKKSNISVVLPALAAILLAFPFCAYAKPAGFTVMELFTSQGCPSCPPADRLLESIAGADENIITLGCHVSYFDRPNWSDSMAQYFCDARQGAYREMGVADKIYTPQAIINGRHVIIGSHEEEVRSALAGAEIVKPLDLTLKQGYLDIYLPAMELEHPADVWLFGYENMKQQYIEGGSNMGRTISYAHPVTNLTKLISWNGRVVNMSFPLGDFQAESYAIIAQDADTGAIIAAGKAENVIKN